MQLLINHPNRFAYIQLGTVFRRTQRLHLFSNKYFQHAGQYAYSSLLIKAIN
nr:MAG TPA: hypothetical protein [Caudoviricetes sp.]